MLKTGVHPLLRNIFSSFFVVLLFQQLYDVLIFTARHDSHNANNGSTEYGVKTQCQVSSINFALFFLLAVILRAACRKSLRSKQPFRKCRMRIITNPLSEHLLSKENLQTRWSWKPPAASALCCHSNRSAPSVSVHCRPVSWSTSRLDLRPLLALTQSTQCRTTGRVRETQYSRTTRRLGWTCVTTVAAPSTHMQPSNCTFSTKQPVVALICFVHLLLLLCLAHPRLTGNNSQEDPITHGTELLNLIRVSEWVVS